MRFGTLPSNIDAPTNEDKQEEYLPSFKFIHAKNHFGALSERGLSLKIEVEGFANAAVQYGVLVRTKIDVPYSDITVDLDIPYFLSSRGSIQRITNAASSATSSTVTYKEAKVGKPDSEAEEPENLLHHINSREKTPLVMDKEMEKRTDQSTSFQPKSERVEGNKQGESSETGPPLEGETGVQNMTAQVDVKEPSEQKGIEPPFEDIINALQLLTRAMKTFAALSRQNSPIPDTAEAQYHRIKDPIPKPHSQSPANKPQQLPTNKLQQPPYPPLHPRPRLHSQSEIKPLSHPKPQLQNTPAPKPKLLTISPSKVTPVEKELPEEGQILSQAAINEWIEKARASYPSRYQVPIFRRVEIAPLRKVEVRV